MGGVEEDWPNNSLLRGRESRPALSLPSSPLDWLHCPTGSPESSLTSLGWWSHQQISDTPLQPGQHTGHLFPLVHHSDGKMHDKQAIDVDSDKQRNTRMSLSGLCEMVVVAVAVLLIRGGHPISILAEWSRQAGTAGTSHHTRGQDGDLAAWHSSLAPRHATGNTTAQLCTLTGAQCTTHVLGRACARTALCSHIWSVWPVRLNIP